MNEADTCRTYVLPKLKSAGWEDEHITEQMVLTPGRIVAYPNSVPLSRDLRQAWLVSRKGMISLRELQSATGDELSALLPSVVDKAFKGEL
jgi:hypothetical protein